MTKCKISPEQSKQRMKEFVQALPKRILSLVNEAPPHLRDKAARMVAEAVTKYLRK